MMDEALWWATFHHALSGSMREGVAPFEVCQAMRAAACAAITAHAFTPTSYLGPLPSDEDLDELRRRSAGNTLR